MEAVRGRAERIWEAFEIGNLNRTRMVFLVFLLLASGFVSASAVSSDPAHQPPEWLYLHGGLNGNLYTLSSDDMSSAMAPFKLSPVHFGWAVFATCGFRNVAQLEWRWGKDTSSFFHDEGITHDFEIQRTTIPMTFHHNEWLVKLSPFFSGGDPRQAMFLSFGMGSVEFLDDADDGFGDGSKTVLGFEYRQITRRGEWSVAIERHGMEFDSFFIEGIGTLEQSFEATAYLLLVSFAFGTGR